MAGRFLELRSASVALAIASAAVLPPSATAGELLHKKTTKYELVRGYILAPATAQPVPTAPVPTAPVVPALAPAQQAAPSSQSPGATGQAPVAPAPVAQLTPAAAPAQPQAAPVMFQMMAQPVQQVQQVQMMAAPMMQVQMVAQPVQQVQMMAAPVQQFQMVAAPVQQQAQAVQVMAAPTFQAATTSVATPVDILIPAKHHWLPSLFR